MSWFTLELYDTDIASMDGESPNFVKLDQEVVTIGRGSQSRNVDIKVWARHKGTEIISRQHAKIVRTRTTSAPATVTWQFHIHDLGAVNGTFVDNIRVDISELHDGSIIQLGGNVANVGIGQALPAGGRVDNCVRYVIRFPTPPPPPPPLRPTRAPAPAPAPASQAAPPQAAPPQAVPTATTGKRAAFSVDGPGSPLTAQEAEACQALRNWFFTHGGITRPLAVTYVERLWNDGVGSVARLEAKLRRHENYFAGLGFAEDDVEALREVVREIQRVTTATATAPSSSSSSSSTGGAGGSSADGASGRVGAGVDGGNGNADGLSFLATHALRQTQTGHHEQDASSRAGGEGSGSRSSAGGRTHGKGGGSSGVGTAVSADTTGSGASVSGGAGTGQGTGTGTSAGCSIDISILRSHLACALCALPLLDAVVLPCSHGFCRSCLEQHLRSGNKRGTGCPNCAGESESQHARPTGTGSSSSGSGSSSSGTGVGTAAPTRVSYVRSMHLDNLVYVLNLASSAAEQEVFAEREARARRTLLDYGVDPDTNPGVAESGEGRGEGTGSEAGMGRAEGAHTEEEDEEDEEGEDEGTSGSNGSYDRNRNCNSNRDDDSHDF